MKQITLIYIAFLTIASVELSAQITSPQKPVRTGDEWKIPSDAFKRSKDFADNLQTRLKLDSIQKKKVYDIYLSNTKPLDKIGILSISDKEKGERINANKAAFDESLKKNIYIRPV